MVGRVDYGRVLAEILEQSKRLNDSVGRLEDLPLPDEVEAIKGMKRLEGEGKSRW